MFKASYQAKEALKKNFDEDLTIKEYCNGTFISTVPNHTKLPYIFIKLENIKKVPSKTEIIYKMELIVAIYIQNLNNKHQQSIIYKIENILENKKFMLQDFNLVSNNLSKNNVINSKNGNMVQLNLHNILLVEEKNYGNTTGISSIT